MSEKPIGSLALIHAAAATREVPESGEAEPVLTKKPPMPARRVQVPENDQGTGCLRDFMRRHLLHYNGGTTTRAAEAWLTHAENGGAMMLTLAGAMSTAQMGRSIAALIRANVVHLICTTGANLEEDIMNLIGRDQYEEIPDYRDMSREDEDEIWEEGMNRVTDSAIPDTVMVPLAKAMMKEWVRADKKGERYFPHEILYKVLRSGVLENRYVEDPEDSWVLCAMEHNLPIVVAGWEDSTLGNNYAAALLQGKIKNAATCRSGHEYMCELAAWYAKTAAKHDMGFFQIGGGIAGDFPICVVPMLHEELGRDDLPMFAYFAQVTDAHESYGGYSGAVPREKQTWSKINADTQIFDIHSDATIVAPLIFGFVLGW